MRAGVAVPRVLEEKGFELVEEFIEGQRLKELINETDEKQRGQLAGMLGAAVAKLHSTGIIHGDLTTSNMILYRSAGHDGGKDAIAPAEKDDEQKDCITPTEGHDEQKDCITPTKGHDEQKDDIYFIDFGLGFLSEKPEDQGTDLAVLREAFQSTHFRFFERLWNGFETAYRKSFHGAGQSLKALAAIERRGRYVRRTA